MASFALWRMEGSFPILCLGSVLSLFQVLDLVDPVIDQKGYVYEKAIIVTYIRQEIRKSGEAKCPQAGESPQLPPL